MSSTEPWVPTLPDEFGFCRTNLDIEPEFEVEEFECGGDGV